MGINFASHHQTDNRGATMNTHVLQLFKPDISLKTAYIVLFTLYGIAVLSVVRMGAMEQLTAVEVKMWIMLAAITLLLSIVGVFLKRLLDSFDRTGSQLNEHNKYISIMMEQQKYQNEKFERVERQIEGILSRQGRKLSAHDSQ